MPIGIGHYMKKLAATKSVMPYSGAQTCWIHAVVLLACLPSSREEASWSSSGTSGQQFVAITVQELCII